MASKETWDKLRHFSPKEGNWGDATKMDDDLLLILDDFRATIGCPVFILQGNGGRHSEKSWHYVENGSKAVDIIIPDWKLHPIDQLLMVFRFPFTGIGYYPDWQYYGAKCGGFHLDVRPLKDQGDGTLDYRHNRWMGVNDPTGKQIYIPMNYENILTYSKRRIENARLF